MISDEQLSRTTLLFQIDLGLADQTTVLNALVSPTIQLVADNSIVNSFAGQVALSTAAMLAARSGHNVYVDTSDEPLHRFQPPMNGRTFLEAVSAIGTKLIDGTHIKVGTPPTAPNITFVFGNVHELPMVRAKKIFWVSWTKWSARLSSDQPKHQIPEANWPIGAMGASVLVAAETAKLVGRALARISAHPVQFREFFASRSEVKLSLAPESTSLNGDIGTLDVISAGAISNAFMYALARIPGVIGNTRVFDKDISDNSNRNRNMLLLPELVGFPKIDAFRQLSPIIALDLLSRNFDKADLSTLAKRVIVGVDHIPTRWLLATAQSSWMGVGATSHFNSMSSVHYRGFACAACLHPKDEDQTGPTPTVAFASFLSGLMLIADLLQEVSGDPLHKKSHYRYDNALQPNPWISDVIPRGDCPANCTASRHLLATTG